MIPKVQTYTINAIIAGILGSLGSFLGKLSGSFDYYIYSLLFFIAMVVSNTIGCIFFAKSLDLSATTLQPALISTASNYLFTAFLGVLFFEETTGLLWFLGTTLILSGIILVSQEKKLKVT
ncbi:hypothetical protein O3M35_011019 [Rhynocoris fuscipes]|uniref:EamA domain-containing protein n=1 Tax=Rhynocoris fuscipes TaxID=488301 RepID=A0AAW1CW26_9HEMI